MKLALVALLSAVVIFASQWYYHPSVPTTFVASLVLLVLLSVVTWSARRFGQGAAAIAKTLVVSTVSGLMFSQAMDVSYSVLSAPAGGRLGFPLEMLVIGLGLALLARLLAFAIGSKVEKQSRSHQSERTPE